MLRIRGLVAGYEDAGSVLEGIDLEVAAGESVALMGRNGMGKTTLLRAIMGLLRPTAGEVVLDGGALTGRPPFEISNAGIAYAPQGREIFRDFTVEENPVVVLALTTRCLFIDTGRIVDATESAGLREERGLLDRYVTV